VSRILCERKQMKVFRGTRTDGRNANGGFIVKVVDAENEKVKVLSAATSQKLVNHSPNGFNWDYGGSGPSQLALGLLLDVTADTNLSLRYYQQFKWEIVAQLPDTWELTETSILEWIEQQTK